MTISTLTDLSSVTSPLASGRRLAAAFVLGAAVLFGLPAIGNDRAEAQTVLRGPPAAVAAGLVLKGMSNPATRGAVLRGLQKHRQAFNRSWGPAFGRSSACRTACASTASTSLGASSPR